MSRNVLWPLLLFAGTAPPLAAQSSPPTNSADQAIEAAREAYGPPRPEPRCRAPASPDEIVVCAADQDQDQFRVRSDRDAEDDYARETMNKGDPKAPDVAGPGIFRGAPTVGSLCIPGLQKCPPPPAIMVDFSQLPEAPPGSDADRIARGLPPLGNDGDPTETMPQAAPPPD
jgi:hypothetical protein